MSRRRWLLVVYFTALVVSRAVIVLGPSGAEPPLPDGMSAVAVPASALVGTEPSPTRYRLAYRSLGPRSADAILLLHGSPGSLQDFDALAQRFGPDRFVLVPDMLGFGASASEVPSHSFEVQARALIELMDAEGVSRAHVVGFSWGGGVAIELARIAPGRVHSLVMVSAIGVQELELLGRYELNHLVHAFQHGLVVALDWGLPHFGALSGGPFGVGFTRSFLDSDQRPMRETLRAFKGPMLIVHGREDFLVPPAAAAEHHRLVPQSELVWIDGGHLVLWSEPARVAGALRDWFTRADERRLPLAGDALAERAAAAALPFDSSLAGPQDGIGWIVFCLLVFVASMISEDLTCAGVGLLVATGQVGFAGGVAACIFALVLGDLVLYVSGRVVGPPLLRRFGRDPGEVGPIAQRMERSGGWAVLLGRFVPGARLPTYVAAGVLGFPAWRFTFWLIVAAALWAPFLVGLTALGGEALEMESASPRAALASGLLLILTLGLLARLLPSLATFRGRGLLRSKWARLMRWEFWPIWAIYGAMSPSLLSMMLRYRSVRMPTLVNPLIPGGGLAGESKTAIGEALDRAEAHAIPTLVLEPGGVESRTEAAERFQAQAEIGWPLVFKPDVGERGRGVAIVRDTDGIREYLEAEAGRTLVQAFVGGDEFGLFFIRRPGLRGRKGELFSIARKSPREVIGNGVDSLERLILLDPICLPMAPKLLRLNGDRLQEVPAMNERVRVTELGTHSLGCRFLVGEDLRSEALEEAVDRLSATLDVDLGRYDVRAPDEAALMRGEFKVIEFNGLTGEPAHMYDPRYGLFAGLRILRAQWEAAFEIGAAHRAAGRHPLTWSALVRLVWTSRG